MLLVRLRLWWRGIVAGTGGEVQVEVMMWVLEEDVGKVEDVMVGDDG